MDEKKLNDEELEAVSGGRNSFAGFLAEFCAKQCGLCTKNKGGRCPYGEKQERYEAFGRNPDATCPDREVM